MNGLLWHLNPLLEFPYGIYGIYQKHVPVSHRNYPSHHQFYPLSWGMNIQNNDMTPTTS
jgi:hypothetical protein